MTEQDKREALIRDLRLYSDAYWPLRSRGDINPSYTPGNNPGLARTLDAAADALLCQAQITEAVVKAAYDAFVDGPTDALASMRAALEAAEEARRG